MASTSKAQVSYSAYATVILHAAKHPAASVTGLLLGSTSSSGYDVERAIPLVHHWTDLSPMTEVGCSLVEAYASESSPALRIIGVYHAPASVSTSSKGEVPHSAVKLAQTVSKKLNADAIILQVNNALLSSSTAHALQPFQLSSSGSKKPLKQDAVTLKDDNSIRKVKGEVGKGTWKEVIDFDDHLEDSSLNWLKPLALSV